MIQMLNLKIKTRIHSLTFYTGCFLACLVFPPSISAADIQQTAVELHGQLSVSGTKIVNEDKQPLVLRGMSLFWSQWMGKYYNYDCVEWLRDDWKCNVVRASMGIEMDGYLDNKETEKAKILAVIDACINLGIYVIVDWHDHNAHIHEQEAIDFFKEIATLYGDRPNLIYEIFNEPEQDSWVSRIKPYADTVIYEIRKIDPDNIIIVGTPTWSQDVDIAANNPLAYENIAYALHYYAASHKQSLRDKAQIAINKGIALFVTEFGTCEYTGSGYLDEAETNTWWNFLESNKISWCNWSIADKTETASALKSGASATGGWTNNDLTESGILVKNKIKTLNSLPFTSINQYPDNFDPGLSVYPNPVNSAGFVEFNLNKTQNVIIEIFSADGRKVMILTKNTLHNGSHTVSFPSGKLSSGIYYCRLSTEEYVKSVKFELIR